MRGVVLDARVVTGTGGGPEKTILTSPKFLAPHGYEMVCAYLHPPHDPGFGTLVERARELGSDLVGVPDRGRIDPGVFGRLLELCRSRNVAIYHGHDYKTNVLGLLLTRFHPMRLVTTLHGWVERTGLTPLYFAIDRATLRHYERVYAVSPDLERAACHAGVPPSRRVLLENGIDTDHFRPGLFDRMAVRRQFDLPTSAKVVLGVGRLSPEKAFDDLVRLLPKLADDTHLVIVGEGGERPGLAGLARSLGVANRVRLAGYQRDVRPLFAAADLFCLSSTREGLPNVVLEAMALGVPVVATAIAGVPRVVADGDTGLLVPPRDPGRLHAAVSRLLTEAEFAEEMATRARRSAVVRYSFAGRVARLAASYDTLLAHPPTRQPGQ